MVASKRYTRRSPLGRPTQFPYKRMSPTSDPTSLTLLGYVFVTVVAAPPPGGKPSAPAHGAAKHGSAGHGDAAKGAAPHKPSH